MRTNGDGFVLRKGSRCGYIDFSSCYPAEDMVYTENVIGSADAAKAYADIVMSQIGEDLQHYKTVTRSYDSQNAIWVISYGIDENTNGGEVSIAIAKKTGEVKGIWVGE